MRLSYSRWSLYHGCPFKYKCKYILNLKEPPAGKAVMRGSTIHDMIEQYVAGLSNALPWDANNVLDVPPMGSKHPLQPVVERLRDWPTNDRHVEKELLLDIDMQPFPSTDPAFIVIFDAVAHHDGIVEVEEWKSGKPYDEHAEQRHLYATAALTTWNPKEVHVTTRYVDCTGSPAKLSVTPNDTKQMIELWQGRRETMMNDKILAPRPSGKCRWCHFRKSNGGPCPLDL